MKILLLSEFFLSGQTTHVFELAKQLRRQGHQIHMRLARIHSTLFRPYYAQLLDQWGVQFSTGIGLSSLKYFVKSFSPDIIHAHSSTLFSHANKIASIFDIPYVLTCHGLGFSHPKYRSDLYQADFLIAIGPKVAQEIKLINPKYRIISNGVDTEHFVPPQNPTNNRKKVVYIGRIDNSKVPGITQLATTLEKSFNTSLHVVGDRDPQVAGTNFSTWKPNLLPTLQQFGIVATCGRTAREALACGNVVLLMQKHYDGFISPALVTKADFDFSGNIGRYSFRRLKTDLEKLFTSRSGLVKLQKWGRNYAVTHCSSSIMADEVLQIYEQVFIPRPFRIGNKNTPSYNDEV